MKLVRLLCIAAAAAESVNLRGGNKPEIESGSSTIEGLSLYDSGEIVSQQEPVKVEENFKRYSSFSGYVKPVGNDTVSSITVSTSTGETSVGSQTCPVKPSYCNAPAIVPTTTWGVSYNDKPVVEVSLNDLSTVQTDHDGSFREYNGVRRYCTDGFRAAGCDCSIVNSKMQDWLNSNDFKFGDSTESVVIDLSNVDHGMGLKWDGLMPDGETKIGFKTKLQGFWDSTLKDESCFEEEKTATWKKGAEIYGYVTAGLAFVGLGIGLANGNKGEKCKSGATGAAIGACLPLYCISAVACDSKGRELRRGGYGLL